MSWQDEFRNRLTHPDDIANYLSTKIDSTEYPSNIPRKFLTRILNAGNESALYKQFIPSPQENGPQGLNDPIGDHEFSKGNGIIHRYESRILFTPTTTCPIQCRYCFRKNELNHQDEIFNYSLKALTNYLESHPEVNEVILTGGDPLMVSNKKLERILSLLASTQVKFVRFHTRTPIILPSRIDQEFIDLINRYENKFIKIIFVLHSNHISEFDLEVDTALKRLQQTNMLLKTQSVLLKSINDNAQDLINLFYKFVELGFSPYYLHHPDLVKGAMHFYLPLEEGRKIYHKLRAKLPGWAIPHYVVDHPEGIGKQLAFNPESIEFSGAFLDQKAKKVKYPILN